MSAHRSARPRDRLNRGDLSCAEQWMSKEATYGALCRKTSPSLAPPRHRRQLPHTAVSARLEPLAFPYQHEASPKNLTQKPTSPTHQHRRPPPAFDPTTAAQPSQREPSSCPIADLASVSFICIVIWRGRTYCLRATFGILNLKNPPAGAGIIGGEHSFCVLRMKIERRQQNIR